MKKYKNLMVDDSDKVLTITINREKKLNALNRSTMLELKDIFCEIDKNFIDYSGIILTGSGEKSFVAGADIGEFMTLNYEEAYKLAQQGQKIFSKIEECKLPVIAVVNGYALGGGCELAMAAQMRVATENAIFGQPEVNLGLMCGYGGSQRMAQLIGKGRAFEYLLTSDNMTAESALKFGLVNHVLKDKESALEKAKEIVQKIAKKAPLAIQYTIEAINAQFDGFQEGYEKELLNFAKCFDTKDLKEGVQAFLEKRPAKFRGE